MNILSSARRAAAALYCLTLLAGCSTPYSPPQILDASTRFPGLVDLPVQTEGHTADIVLVHGICTHDARWAQQVVAQLTQAIDGATMSIARAAAPDAGGIEIVPSTIETPAGRLRFNALIWSPLTTPLKRQLCYDQTGKSAACTGAPPYPHQRALLNARLKDTLIDDCLPDALIYQGVARDAIQLRMRDAILRVLADGDATDTVPLVVIAHSMGSKIMFDTLLGMTLEAPASRAATTARRTMERMRILVMAANQIPLLSLADQPLDGAAGAIGIDAGAGRGKGAGADVTASTGAGTNAGVGARAGAYVSAGTGAKAGAGAAGAADTGATAGSITVPAPGAAQAAAPDSLQLLLRQRGSSDQRRVPAPLTLVAFTDPNDVLSYTLPPERYASERVKVFNILVSNAPTWLGLLERPDSAHLDYLKNPDVGRLMACGVPASALCKR